MELSPLLVFGLILALIIFCITVIALAGIFSDEPDIAQTALDPLKRFGQGLIDALKSKLPSFGKKSSSSTEILE